MNSENFKDFPIKNHLLDAGHRKIFDVNDMKIKSKID